MDIKPDDTVKRALGDANDQFAVTQLNKDEQFALARHVYKKHDDKDVVASSAYMITDNITGEQYAMAAAIKSNHIVGNPMSTMDIDFVAVQFENEEVIKPDQNVFQKLGGADAVMPSIKDLPAAFEIENGNTMRATAHAADSIHPKVLARLISAEQNKHAPTYNPDVPDARAKLRSQSALSDALQERREELYEAIRVEDTQTSDNTAKSELYRVSIEPETFTLNKDGELVGHKENERIFNGNYAALSKGASIDLGDTNNQYLITKPNDSITNFLNERAYLGDGDTFINATGITKKGENATTFIYAVTDKENNSGRFKAVRIDDEGMVLADGKAAFAGIGIDANRLNQGSKWGNTEDGDATSSKLNQTKFFSQMSPNNLRQMVAQTQIREYQKEIGNDIAYRGFDSGLLEIPEITASKEARYKESGPRGMLVADDVAKAIAKATFTDRHEVITLNKQQMEDLVVYTGARERTMADDIYNYEIASAVMLVDHHADNSHAPEPGVARRSRVITQAKVESENSVYGDEAIKASIEYASHNIKDGEYVSSNYPMSDSRHSLNIRRAVSEDGHAEIDDKYEDMKLLSSSAVVDAAINSINNSVRYDENSQLMKGEPGVSERHEVMAHIDNIKAAATGNLPPPANNQEQVLAAAPKRNRM